MRRLRRHHRRVARAFAILAILAPIAVGCASPIRVQAENQIVMARYAVREAIAKEAGSYAPEELAIAVAKLEEAQSANPEPAIRLAEQATVQARLASAVAVREFAEAQLAEAMVVQQQSETLRSETIEAVKETER